MPSEENGGVSPKRARELLRKHGPETATPKPVAYFYARVPPELYARVQQLVAERKRARVCGELAEDVPVALAAIVRVAVERYLDSEEGVR